MAKKKSQTSDAAKSRPTRQTKASTKSVETSKGLEHDNPAAVDAKIAELDPTLGPIVQSVREVILKVDRKVTEGIKWNSPSFYLNDWFATVNVRGQQGVMVVLHHGAKARDLSALPEALDDPANLLQWHGKDRASITFVGAADFREQKKAFAKIIKAWLVRHRALTS
jgi:hypothetical protein